jgi:hypothetical protein
MLTPSYVLIKSFLLIFTLLFKFSEPKNLKQQRGILLTKHLLSTTTATLVAVTLLTNIAPVIAVANNNNEIAGTKTQSYSFHKHLIHIIRTICLILYI